MDFVERAKPRGSTWEVKRRGKLQPRGNHRRHPPSQNEAHRNEPDRDVVHRGAWQDQDGGQRRAAAEEPVRRVARSFLRLRNPVRRAAGRANCTFCASLVLRKPHEGLRLDYTRVALAAYFVELIELVTETDHPAPELARSAGARARPFLNENAGFACGRCCISKRSLCACSASRDRKTSRPPWPSAGFITGCRRRRPGLLKIARRPRSCELSDAKLDAADACLDAPACFHSLVTLFPLLPTN